MFQLPLSVALRDDASFDNFSVNNNELLVNKIQQCIGQKVSEGSIFFWGENTAGKTHLLQAACAQAASLELNAAYIPLAVAHELDVKILHGLESFDLICIDDIDLIAGQANWEKAVFELYNRTFESNSQIVITATHSLKETPLQLPDLISRLSWGFVFHLLALTDDEKPKALQAHAKVRGFELPDNVATYLLNHYPRDMNVQCGLLDELDKATLTAQRKLSVPFVKQWLDPIATPSLL